MTTVEIALTVLLSLMLKIAHVYDPVKARVTLSYILQKLTVTIGICIPFGSRIWNVVMSEMFLNCDIHYH